MNEFPFVFREGLPHRPVIVAFHGTGGDEHWFSDLAQDLVPDDGYLGVRGLVSENGMNRYFRRFAEGQLDYEDVAFRTSELADWLRTRPELAGRTAVAVGYSNGANIAQSLILSGANLFSFAILLRPMYLPVLQPGVDLSGTEVLILAGENDELCPPDDAVQLSTTLAEAGAEPHLKMLPAGHGLTQMDLQLVEGFLTGLTARTQ